MSKVIKVGSRKSLLALTQTRWVIEQLKQRFFDYQFEIVELTTTGDSIQHIKLDKIGGKGLFIKELQEAMAEGSIDFAVHSLKDMPAEMIKDTEIAAIPKRVCPMDVLVLPKGKQLEDLKADSIIGTSSVRRECQIGSWRPDCQIKMLRGNVPTRLKRLDDGDYDAIVLAAAGLIRLDLSKRITYTFDLAEMIPAVGQGALAIEAPKHSPIKALLQTLNDRQTKIETDTERTFLKALDGSCAMPIGALAKLTGDLVSLTVMYGTEDSVSYRRLYKACALGEHFVMAKNMAEQLRR